MVAETIMHGIARVGFNLELFLAVKHAVCGDSVMLIAHPHHVPSLYLYFKLHFVSCTKWDRENEYNCMCVCVL